MGKAVPVPAMEHQGLQDVVVRISWHVHVRTSERLVETASQRALVVPQCFTQANFERSRVRTMHDGICTLQTTGSTRTRREVLTARAECHSGAEIPALPRILTGPYSDRGIRFKQWVQITRVTEPVSRYCLLRLEPVTAQSPWADQFRIHQRSSTWGSRRQSG